MKAAVRDVAGGLSLASLVNGAHRSRGFSSVSVPFKRQRVGAVGECVAKGYRLE